MNASVVFMGVAGCGKSSLGAAVASALGLPLVEGDDFHSPESRAKMAQGIALTDADRDGWLTRLGQELQHHMQGTNQGVVLTCSALKLAYRQRLRAAVPGLRFVFLDIGRADAQARVAARSAHFFSASLIADVLPRIWERDVVQGKARLEELRELTRGALAEMRTLLLELRPATLTESSLAELLRQLTQAIGGRSRMHIALHIEGERPLPPETQVALYRITQEALNNISKYAGASQVAINLTFHSDVVRLSVQDNGRGFDPADIRPHSLGLGIMRERAQKIGAVLTIESRIGEGTVVRVACPVANGREETYA